MTPPRIRMPLGKPLSRTLEPDLYAIARPAAASAPIPRIARFRSKPYEDVVAVEPARGRSDIEVGLSRVRGSE